MIKTLLILALCASTICAQSPGERMLADYFRRQTNRVAQRTLSKIQTLDQWKAQKEIYRQQLLEMLGLAPLPQKTDLKVTLVGKLETEKFLVEKLHFQSLPGLYVSANLYLPKQLTKPAPTILYLCGHSRVFKDGVAYGNKAGYQHHPAWFAEHGYVAMIIDTLDLGEIEGEHHGTSRRGWWWWPTRGYTPAGVETWNAIRALDYLSTRPEVDMRRVGLTGRSGGGAYTWFVAAVDNRPSVLVPVAGITDMTNHVVDGAIEGHCDCMYQVNTYGWDFGLLAALSAPRPLLFSNSDKDPIFPLDGVVRIHQQIKRIYKLYGAEDQLGLLITEGPHRDTQELQVPAFRWMNRWLKKDDSPVTALALKRFTPEELKVFRMVPTDQLNTRIHEVFVPTGRVPQFPSTPQEWKAVAAQWMRLLREKTFNNWPDPPPQDLQSEVISDRISNGVRVRIVEFSPDSSYRLQIVVLTSTAKKPTHLSLHVQDHSDLIKWSAIRRRYFSELLPMGDPEMTTAYDEGELLQRLHAGNAIALVWPRGVGATAWPVKKDVQIRRRFLLLGQSLETLQVWDTRMALAAVRALPDMKGLPLSLEGVGTMGVVALFASIFESGVTQLEMKSPPTTLERGPSFPNVLRYIDLPQIVALALPRKIVIKSSPASAWEWSVQAAQLSGGSIQFK